jgi:hypothetical protein
VSGWFSCSKKPWPKINSLNFTFFSGKKVKQKKVAVCCKSLKIIALYSKNRELAALCYYFFSTAKKSKQKMPRLRKPAKDQSFFLKTVNSLRSDRTVFLTEKTLIFLTPFS